MPQFLSQNKKLILAAAVLLLLLAGGVAWVERSAILSWYYVRNLARADDGSRAVWVERVAGLGEEAVPHLLNYLTDANPAVCRNAAAGLARLSQQWGVADGRTVSLAMRCGREFNQFSAAGRQCMLELAAGWFRDVKEDTPPAQGLLPACVRFVTETAAENDPDTQDRALELCAVLLNQPQGAEALSSARDLVRNCLSSESPANRFRAVQVALHPGMDLYEEVAGLLKDPSAEVRRAAIVGVGPVKRSRDPDADDYVVLDDVLLPCLHDADTEMRRLTEVVLQSRGRTPAQIRLGFFLTAPDPVVRIRVVEQLRRVPDVDQAMWLTRVSHDPSPAIRAAAARALGPLSAADNVDDRARTRLDEMARTDPSATVCLLARYYLEKADGSD
jgi:HEAT repeat protein